ncbi:tyrosine decarboxylase 1-like isoform X2 [Ananas comosus]|uniref:Tyrosine decarboxylase 1-like isoform X2 n=1 Tax=Ananas comosus TaxID=4615 RepID=A0A6P5GR12_ANACO|nr:tyrosine decarboxylase 1-like isoform X2 [Ananas comosus]
MDSEQLREYAHKMVVDFIADYYKMSESFPVLSQVEPGYLKELLPDSAPSKPENLEDVFDDIRQKIIPGITHRQSPDYFAYYPSNSSTAGFLGEMLSAGFNIVGFSWIASSVATELEMLVLDWFAKSLSCLSSSFQQIRIAMLLMPISLAFGMASLLWEAAARYLGEVER